MKIDATRFAGRLIHRCRVHARKSELKYLIATSRMMYVGWRQELAYIERTGRLDWVDPNRPRIRPAGDRLLPPPSQPRPDVSVVFKMISRG